MLDKVLQGSYFFLLVLALAWLKFVYLQGPTRLYKVLQGSYLFLLVLALA